MRLEFENWIDNQNIPNLATEVFKEAVICYKANAYRAAMLLSFSAFQIILKSRIIAADKPNEVVDKKWDEYQAKLASDDQWDTFLSNNIIPATDVKCKIFDITEDLSGQHTFWKNRRNDAAHSKDNKLNNSYIEAFWQFVESNLPKYVIIGSHQELTNKIRSYFDLSETSRSADFLPLVREIPKAIDAKKKISFLETLIKITDKSRRPEDQILKFWNTLLDLEGISEEVHNFLLRPANQSFYYSIVQLFPSRLAFLHKEETFLRRIYKKWLFKYYHQGDFKVLNYLVNNRFIPADEIDEILEELLHKWYRLYERSGNFLPDKDELKVFKEYLFPIWEEGIISKIDDWEWANDARNRTIVENYLEIQGVSESLVKKICSTFSKGGHPYGMYNTLNIFFGEYAHLNILEDFIRIAEENDYKLPYSWHLKKKAERIKAALDEGKVEEPTLEEL